MGSFEYKEERENNRRNHKRTATFTLTIPTAHLDRLAAAIQKGTGNWSGAEISSSDGITEVSVTYGPVVGSYASDVRKFVTHTAGVRIINGPKFEGAEHASDCEHPKHD